jgi:Arabinose-binding domain of AraC transcription regulator, N-term
MLRAVKLGRRRSAVRSASQLEVVAPLAPTRPGQQAITGVGLWPWVELAGRHGLPLPELAQLVGVTVSELRDPDRRFDQSMANHVVELVCSRVGPDAGLAAALTAEAGQFALLEVLARTAPTIGLALAQVSRFFSLVHTGVDLQYQSQPDGAGVLRALLPHDYEVHHGFAEFVFGACLVTMRRETEQPSIVPLEVWLRRRAPPDRSLYDRVFGRVLFDMSEDRMLLSRETVALALTRSNAEVHAAAVHGAKELVRD